MKVICIIIVTSVLQLSVYSQDKSCACCTENHSAFNFWVGEWEVTLPNGKNAGKNSITHKEGKCVIQEKWISASPGYTGTSNNFYNLKTKQWEQIWIDNQGASLHLKGNKIDNKMILRSDDEIDKDGNTFYNRVTWTDNADGTVRQLWETITKMPDGEKVAIAFDGLYKKTSR